MVIEKSVFDLDWSVEKAEFLKKNESLIKELEEKIDQLILEDRKKNKGFIDISIDLTEYHNHIREKLESIYKQAGWNAFLCCGYVHYPNHRALVVRGNFNK